jgi:uncharacterized protein YdhG (YjbR/CyaY superfamily)
VASRFDTVDEYIDALPEHVQPIVERIRATIRDVVPGVGEKISYSMPTFTLDGMPLVHVAAWKKHIGLYPLPELEGPLADEVAPYRGAKDALHLPLQEPVPYGLVGRVVTVLAERHRASDRERNQERMRSQSAD